MLRGRTKVKLKLSKRTTTRPSKSTANVSDALQNTTLQKQHEHVTDYPTTTTHDTLVMTKQQQPPYSTTETHQQQQPRTETAQQDTTVTQRDATVTQHDATVTHQQDTTIHQNNTKTRSALEQIYADELCKHQSDSKGTDISTISVDQLSSHQPNITCHQLPDQMEGGLLNDTSCSESMESKVSTSQSDTEMSKGDPTSHVSHATLIPSENTDYMDDTLIQQASFLKRQRTLHNKENATVDTSSDSEQEDIYKTLSKRPIRKAMEEIREQGLANPIQKENKGFQMLAKMGFVEGKGLGKHKHGRVEPLEVSIRSHRSGLGAVSERTKKKQTANERRKSIAKRAKAHHEARNVRTNVMNQDFRAIMSERYTMAQTQKDLVEACRICRMLDLQSGLYEEDATQSNSTYEQIDTTNGPYKECTSGTSRDENTHTHEWNDPKSSNNDTNDQYNYMWHAFPPTKDNTEQNKPTPGANMLSMSTLEDTIPETRSNDLAADQSQDILAKKRTVIAENERNETNENESIHPATEEETIWYEATLSERLDMITTYLREQHLYCLWCQHQYNTIDELEQYCPGLAKQDHEED